MSAPAQDEPGVGDVGGAVVVPREVGVDAVDARRPTMPSLHGPGRVRRGEVQHARGRSRSVMTRWNTPSRWRIVGAQAPPAVGTSSIAELARAGSRRGRSAPTSRSRASGGSGCRAGTRTSRSRGSSRRRRARRWGRGGSPARAGWGSVAHRASTSTRGRGAAGRRRECPTRSVYSPGSTSHPSAQCARAAGGDRDVDARRSRPACARTTRTRRASARGARRRSRRARRTPARPACRRGRRCWSTVDGHGVSHVAGVAPSADRRPRSSDDLACSRGRGRTGTRARCPRSARRGSRCGCPRRRSSAPSVGVTSVTGTSARAPRATWSAGGRRARPRRSGRRRSRCRTPGRRSSRAASPRRRRATAGARASPALTITIVRGFAAATARTRSS